MMFFPVLSTRSPNIGDMGADMTYTTLPREYKRYLMKYITAREKNPKGPLNYQAMQTLAHLV